MTNNELAVAARRPQMLARAAVVGVIVYVAIDVLLRFLRPQYSLLYNAESDYGRGSWYWVMDINFLLRCALSLAVVGALWRLAATKRSMRIGLILLIVWAVCSGLLAFFADDIEGQPTHGSGVVHIVLAFIAFLAVAGGTLTVSVALRAHPSWRSVSTVLVVVSALGVVALLVMGHATGHKHTPGGLYERIFLALELAWIALVGIYLGGRQAASGDRAQPALPPQTASR